MATVEITYFGVHGSGRTVTEAKKDAGRKIEDALSGTYTPEIFTHRGNAILVYREPHGWCSRLIADTEIGVRAGKVWGSSNNSFESARRSALLHLAQLGWQPEDNETATAFLDRDSRAEFRSWVEFQLRYREGKANGLNNNDAHSYAGRDPSKSHLWAEQVA